MNRQPVIAIAALAVMLSGPAIAQKIGSESIQNNPVPPVLVAPTISPVPTVGASGTTGGLSSTQQNTASPAANPIVVPAVTPTQMFFAQAGALLRKSTDIASLAQDKSSNPAILDLAREISRQDNDLLAGVTELSAQGSSNPVTGSASELQALSRVPSGDLFDDQYVKMQAALTQQLAAMFQAQAQSHSTDGTLMDFATKALPGLQQVAAQSQALTKRASTTSP